jgi:hypothetical protein
MVEEVRRRLTTQGGCGGSSLQVFDTCTNTIMEFQAWSCKRTPSDELPPGPDKFEDKDNHAMGVVKGVLATNPRCTTSHFSLLLQMKWAIMLPRTQVVQWIITLYTSQRLWSRCAGMSQQTVDPVPRLLGHPSGAGVGIT